MAILVHFPVPCHSLLSATPSHLLKKVFCGEDEMAVGLDVALGDVLTLRLFVDIGSFSSPPFRLKSGDKVTTHTHTQNCYIYLRFSLHIHTYFLPFFFLEYNFTIQICSQPQARNMLIKKKWILI